MERGRGDRRGKVKERGNGMGVMGEGGVEVRD